MNTYRPIKLSQFQLHAKYRILEVLEGLLLILSAGSDIADYHRSQRNQHRR
uniref:Uncharacterized protein n=1 Tax=viral metagenome TaxID=1070528 RepID=A0A6H1ZK74_9ZZZZ